MHPRVPTTFRRYKESEVVYPDQTLAVLTLTRAVRSVLPAARSIDYLGSILAPKSFTPYAVLQVGEDPPEDRNLAHRVRQPPASNGYASPRKPHQTVLVPWARPKAVSANYVLGIPVVSHPHDHKAALVRAHMSPGVCLSSLYGTSLGTVAYLSTALQASSGLSQSVFRSAIGKRSPPTIVGSFSPDYSLASKEQSKLWGDLVDAARTPAASSSWQRLLDYGLAVRDALPASEVLLDGQRRRHPIVHGRVRLPPLPIDITTIYDVAGSGLLLSLGDPTVTGVDDAVGFIARQHGIPLEDARSDFFRPPPPEVFAKIGCRVAVRGTADAVISLDAVVHLIFGCAAGSSGLPQPMSGPEYAVRAYSALKANPGLPSVTKRQMSSELHLDARLKNPLTSDDRYLKYWLKKYA